MKIRYIIAILALLATHSILYNNVWADVTHRVRAGETLASIAKKYGVTTDAIKSLNPQTERYVYAGMDLTIPGDGKTETATVDSQATTGTQPQNDTKSSKLSSMVDKVKGMVTRGDKKEEMKVEQSSDFFSIPEPEFVPLDKPIEEGGFFEGDLYYRAIENHSKATIRWSYGLAYNGERNLRIVMRGSGLDIIDESLQYHTLLLPDQNKVYLYSDLLQRALEFDYSYVTSYLYSLSPNPSSLTPDVTRTNSIVQTDEVVEYNGDLCNKMKGDLVYNGPGNAHYKVEAWYSKRYSVYKNYWSVFQGLEVTGIVKKWVYTFSSDPLPIVGHIYGSVASELLGVIERKVNEKELTVPAGYTIVHNAKNKDLVSLYKDQRKALNNHGCYPGVKDMREIDNNLLNDWDFVDEFIADSKRQASAARRQMWMQVGIGLFQLGSQIAEVSQRGGDEEEESLGGGSSGGGSGNYQARYNQMEAKARDAYEHMMNTSGNTGTYTSFGKNMRFYQREMRKIRAEAKRHGVTIRKSGMEDAASPGRSAKSVDRNWYGDI